MSRRFAALALALAVSLAAFAPPPAPAQDESDSPNTSSPAEPAPAPPGGAFDAEAYAEGLAGQARAYAAAGDWAKAYGYWKYVRTALGGTAYVRERAREIEAEFAAAQAEVAAAALARAAKTAERNPEKAKEQLAAFQVEHGASRFATEKRGEIEALEAKIRTALWPGRSAWRGAAVLPAEGRLRLAYAFDAVEELADFATGKIAGGAAIEDGRLLLARTGGGVEHRLDVPAGVTVSAEVEGRGTGRLSVVLGALGCEVDATSKEVRIALRRGAVEPLARAAEPRASASRPWKVRVERRGGGGPVVATILREDGTPGASAEAAAPPEAAAPEAGMLHVRLEPASGSKPEVESFSIEGPLGVPAGAEPAAGAAKPPLPRGVFIPLVTRAGLDAWKVQGRWAIEADVLKQESDPASLISRELEGRKLDRYTFTAEIRVVCNDDGRRRARNEAFFAITLPVGEERIAWVFSSREMTLDGAGDAHFIRTLEPARWETVTVRVDARGVEAAVGAERIFSVPIAKVRGTSRFQRADGVAFFALPGPRRIDIRHPKVRLD